MLLPGNEAPAGETYVVPKVCEAVAKAALELGSERTCARGGRFLREAIGLAARRPRREGFLEMRSGLWQRYREAPWCCLS